MREALLEALLCQDLWISETGTVVELCKAATLVDSDLDDKLLQALKSEAMRTTYSNQRDQDDPDTLRWEADSLKELGTLLSWNVTPTYDELMNRAQELDEQMESDDHGDAERLPETETASDAFNIDALFAGLLDR